MPLSPLLHILYLYSFPSLLWNSPVISVLHLICSLNHLLTGVQTFSLNSDRRLLKFWMPTNRSGIQMAFKYLTIRQLDHVTQFEHWTASIFGSSLCKILFVQSTLIDVYGCASFNFPRFFVLCPVKKQVITLQLCKTPGANLIQMLTGMLRKNYLLILHL